MVVLADTMPFLGLNMSMLSFGQAEAEVRRFAASDTWHYVVTPNAAHLSRLGSTDETLSAIYRAADLCLLDSRVVALAGRLAGLRSPPVVPGADLVEHLFRLAIGPSTRVCIIGGTAESIARLREQFGLGAVQHWNPPAGFWRDPVELARAAAFAAEARADYTFLAVGSPQQEILAARIGQSPAARGVGICAGASIDFLTGVQNRAPRILQLLSMEWAYRFACEPRRLARRYLWESPLGVARVFREAFHP